MNEPTPAPSPAEVRFQIVVQEPRPQSGDALIRGFAGIPVAMVVDAMDRMGALDAGITARWSDVHAAGSALTVRTRPGDNVALHRALDVARAGDVLVVDGGGDRQRALFGELMAARAHDLGLAAIVIDGAIRDLASLRRIGLPVFARAVTPAGPYKNGPGEIGSAIACGGQSVRCGDVVVGDEDGVAVVALERAPQVLERARAILAAEQR